MNLMAHGMRVKSPVASWTPQLRWALAVSTSDSARHVLTACPAPRVWMLGQFFGPFLDVDDDGDGQFDLNPVGEAFSCNDPNRVTTCAPGEEEEGACCLAAGGTASSGACVDLPFLECVNAGGVYSHIWSLIQGSDNGLCVYGEDDEIDCPEAACDPVGQLGIHVSMDFTANVSCFALRAWPCLAAPMACAASW